MSAGSDLSSPAGNPHGNPSLCTGCHTSAMGGGLHFGGDVMQLCESCHNGLLAGREIHPVNLTPSAAMAGRMPPEMPLRNGVLTCLTCHDVSSDCKTDQADAGPRYHLLREGRASDPLAFCSRCHASEDYRPFNAHDQIDANGPRTDVCAWCHSDVPDVNSYRDETPLTALRDKSSNVCVNCHSMGKDHPTHSHMGSTPSAETMLHISAYELQAKLRLPFEQLVKYAAAAKRTPRAIPFDENGRTACYTCHNPHEKGLLPQANPRSLGAEAKQAARHRLRAREGKVCVVCHDK